MLPAVWVLGTVLSTGVAYAAVQMVSGSVGESQREPLTSIATAAPVTPTTLLPRPPSGPSEPSANPSAGRGSPTPVQGQPPTPASPPAVQQPPASTRTFVLVGGTAQLSCSGDAIALNWATPTSGFWVETSTENGGATVEVRFRSDSHESRLDAWCAAGSLQSSVREQSS